jgi:signal peptidase
MEPALPVGSVAFIEPVTATEVRAGDVMSFRNQQGMMVTHRVIEVVPSAAGPSFRTQGDANDSPDPSLVNGGQVVGKVRFDVPYLGRLVDLLQRRENFYLFVGLPAALLVLNELWSIGKDIFGPRTKPDAVANSEEPAR